jgi:hypothetical protein
MESITARSKTKDFNRAGSGRDEAAQWFR